MDDASLPLHRQRPSWLTLVAPAAVLVLITLAVYLPATHGPFIFDDPALVRTPDGLIPRLAAEPSRLFEAHRPLSDVTFLLNHWITGSSPAALRMTGVAMHILAGLVLMDLLRRTLSSPIFNRRWEPWATTLAAVIAGLWLIHPIQTQAVAYISQRGEVMAVLFMFIAMNALAMAAGGGRLQGPVKAVVVIACAGAMLSKQTGFIAPIVLLLYDRCFWAGSFASAIRTRILMYAGVLATLVLPWFMGLATLWTSSAVGGQGHVSAGVGTRGFDVATYFFSQQSVLVHYLRQMLWPATLVLDDRLGLMQPAILQAWPAMAIYGSLVVMMTLGVLTLWALWRWPAAGFCGAWFFLTLAPSSSFLPLADLVMEHRMYGASAAVIAMVVMTIAWLIQHGQQRQLLSESAWKLVIVLLIVIPAGALALRTAHRAADYGDAIRLWRSVHDARPANTRAMLALGKLVEERQPKMAAALYHQAARTEPENYEPMIALGSFYLMHDHPAEARKWYGGAWRTSGNRQAYLFNMGLVAQASGDYETAVDLLSKAHDRQTDNAQVLLNLGAAQDQLATRRMLAGEAAAALQLRMQAVQTLDRAVSHNPSSVKARTNLATALSNLGMQRMLLGDGAGADESLRRSLSIEARPDTMRKLAWLWATWPTEPVHHSQLAMQLAQRAAEASPGQPIYGDTLAAAMARAGRFKEAVTVQRRVLAMAQQAGASEDMLKPWRERLALYENGKPFIQSIKPVNHDEPGVTPQTTQPAADDATGRDSVE